MRFKLADLCGDRSLLFRILGDDPRASLYEIHKKNAARINHDALGWMSAQRRPFFAFMNYYDTHAPYLPPRSVLGRFGPYSFTPGERAVLRDWDAGENLQYSAAEIELARDGYDECIAYLDEQVGSLFGELETRGLLENTVVVITADHGEHFGEHAGIFGHMYSLYGQEIRVPLLVIAPGRVPAGQVVSAPVTLRDVAATIVDLAAQPAGSSERAVSVNSARETGGAKGVAAAEGSGAPETRLPGTSLARFWGPRSPGQATRTEPVFAECDKDWLPLNDSARVCRSLCLGEMVYIRNSPISEELYNVASDPAELRNLAGSATAGAELERLRAALSRFLALPAS